VVVEETWLWIDEGTRPLAIEEMRSSTYWRGRSPQFVKGRRLQNAALEA